MRIFTVPFFQYKINNWEEKRRQLMQVCDSVNLQKDPDNYVYTDFFSNREYDPHPAAILEEEIERFRQEMPELQKLDISSSWFQKYTEGSHHCVHNHSQHGFSSVCYIKFNPQVHPVTTFISPLHNPFNGDIIEYTPEVSEGTIIFFPCYMLHYVLPNLSKESRIIYSMNFTGTV